MRSLTSKKPINCTTVTREMMNRLMAIICISRRHCSVASRWATVVRMSWLNALRAASSASAPAWPLPDHQLRICPSTQTLSAGLKASVLRTSNVFSCSAAWNLSFLAGPTIRYRNMPSKKKTHGPKTTTM